MNTLHLLSASVPPVGYSWHLRDYFYENSQNNIQVVFTDLELFGYSGHS